MIRRLYLVVAVLLTAAFMAGGCGNKPDTAGSVATKADKVKVIATIYPVYEFTRQVGGDKVDVTMLIPPGAEPHDWEPTGKDLAKIKNAKLFLYNGGGIEPLDKLLHKDVIGSAVAVELSKGIQLIKGIRKEEGHDDGHGHSHSSGHGSEEKDPHVWLDPEYAKIEVENIANALSDIDPANKEYYRQNARTFQAELTKLHNEYISALASVARRDIVTTHAAFQYLAQRYKLNQIPVMGLAPDAEPTPEKLAAIVKFCREKQVTTIFFESLVSPKIAQTIAKETGAKLLVLNPVDGLTEEDLKKGKNYLSIMRENLENLQTALR